MRQPCAEAKSYLSRSRNAAPQGIGFSKAEKLLIMELGELSFPTRMSRFCLHYPVSKERH